MGYQVPPGAVPGFIITPEAYNRFMAQSGPNLWPVYFGARMAAQTIQDLAMKALQTSNIDALKENLDLMLASGLDVAAGQAAAGPTGDVAELRIDIERLQGGLYDNWKAGIWQGIGAAYSSAMDNLLHTGQLVYAYKTLAYHTAVTPRMRRHWNKTYTPMVPGGAIAWTLFRRGEIARSQYETYMAYDGWSKENADLLVKAMQMSPSPAEAFYLWCKGLITETERDLIYFANGWDDEWHTKITANLQYSPSIYDLTRIADYVELDQTWALDKMKKRGVSDADRAKFWEMLKIRPLREEIAKLTTKALYARQYGYWSHDDLDEYWAEMQSDGYIKATERSLLNTYGDLAYDIELKEEWIEILRWRFRTATITEEQFLEGLVDPDGPVAMQEEKANLIVETEKARGYIGYY